MALEFLIDNRGGKILKAPVSKFEWTTDRVGSAGELTATIAAENLDPNTIKNGAVVRIKDSGFPVFYGFVQRVSGGRDRPIEIKAYDQILYLKNPDTYVYSQTLPIDRVLKDLAKRLDLNLGRVEESPIGVPASVHDDKEALDVFLHYRDETLRKALREYILYDDAGKLTLIGMNKWAIPPSRWYIGDGSLLYDFEWDRSIEDAINRVKIVKDNKKTKKREVHVVQDGESISRWGLKQAFEKADEKENLLEIAERAKNILSAKNYEKVSLTGKCTGNWELQGGRAIFVHIEQLGISSYMLPDQVKHVWDGGIHTMEVKFETVVTF